MKSLSFLNHQRNIRHQAPRRLLLTFLLFSLIATGCLADGAGEQDFNTSEKARPAFDPATCSYDPLDPHEPPARLSKGPFQGECLDTKKRRPLVVLPDDPSAPSTLQIANLFHDDGFWYASLPLDAIEQVYFQLEYFPAVVPAGHTQMRIHFSEPVRLQGHSQWNTGREESVNDIVLSVEAVTRIGDSYDLFKGTQDNFGLVFRMTSLEARYQSMIVDQGHHVEQWELLMEDEEKHDLLRWYASESEALGLNHTYHTLFRNCTTEAIGALDAVVDYTAFEKVKKFFVKVTEIYPNIVRTALIARGLLPLNQSTDWYALEEDPSYEH